MSSFIRTKPPQHQHPELTPPDTFTLFPELPAELRLDIFEQAIKDIGPRGQGNMQNTDFGARWVKCQLFASFTQLEHIIFVQERELFEPEWKWKALVETEIADKKARDLTWVAPTWSVEVFGARERVLSNIAAL
ncbi:hypothetical protein IFR05_004497 [Cadophora sp. M221]|nr:hypothetical protein IFR05_004497 [Cadophora sp. M221]